MTGSSSGEALARSVKRHCQHGTMAINALSATLVAVYLLVVFPPEQDARFLELPLAVALASAYFVAASIFSVRRGNRILAPVHAWLSEDREPTPREGALALRIPVVMAKVTLLDWAVGLVVMSLAALDFGVDFACDVAVTIALAGITTTASAYLLSERSVRPLMSLVLDGESRPPEARGIGIGPRLMLTWLLCSAVPVLMIALIPLTRRPEDPAALVAPIVFASAVALGAGALGTKLATLAVAQPLRSLRRGMDALAAGGLEVRVPVDDGSEIGRLQAGFNAMAEGLRERERLRDLLGRHAGTDVASEMLHRRPSLGGEECCVSVLFVDLVGSTALAHREPPDRVVALLNRFFQTVVEAVHEQGGMVNKFEGDAALCVFGAPVERPDHAARALRAARSLRLRLGAMDGVLDAAISVACGPVVAGYVGAEERFEYTVIGDPVNEASRLVEVAKRHPGRLLASGDAVREAGRFERVNWELDGEILLRGRSVPTQLAVLAGNGAPATLEASRALP